MPHIPVILCSICKWHPSRIQISPFACRISCICASPWAGYRVLEASLPTPLAASSSRAHFLQSHLRKSLPHPEAASGTVQASTECCALLVDADNWIWKEGAGGRKGGGRGQCWSRFKGPLASSGAWSSANHYHPYSEPDTPYLIICIMMMRTA